MTEGKPRPPYTRYHWAKSDRENPERVHLLEHHLADVGACFEALMRQPTIRKRLATAGDLDDLDESLIARLSVFAALHDIGKVNVGFQTQIWRADYLPGKPTAHRAGHTADMVPVLTDQDYTTAGWFFDALGWDDFLTWDDRNGETVCGMLVATLSHHRRPLQLDEGRSENPAIWRRFGDLSPEDCVRRIGRLLCRWFSAAFATEGSQLPSAPPFQHMFLGLCNWADWIGSNEARFPYVDTPQDDYIETARKRAKKAVAAIGLDLSAQRRTFMGVPEFRDLFEIDGSPNSIQETAVSQTPLGPAARHHRVGDRLRQDGGRALAVRPHVREGTRGRSLLRPPDTLRRRPDTRARQELYSQSLPQRHSSRRARHARLRTRHRCR